MTQMKFKTLLTTALVALLGAAPLYAQTTPPADEPLTRPRTGVGVQLTWPAYGVSGILDLNDRLSVQGVVGTTWGYGLSLTGRGLYRIEPQEKFTPYVFGAAGVWTGYLGYTAPSFAAGAGIELDARTFAPDLPALFINLEAGFNVVTYAGGATSYFEVGPGIHYRF